MKRLLTLLTFLLILFTSCDDNKFGGYTKELLPANFSYKILKDQSNIALEKNQLTVELSEKLTEDQVATLAEKLFKSKDKQRRFYIFYLLPGMKDGSGAWATSHFDPDLKIDIIGATPKEEASANTAADKVDGEIVGKWHEEQYTSANYVIFKKDNRIFIRTIFKNGQTSDEELKSKKVSSGTRYDYKESGTNGEYFILSNSGGLEFYNKENKRFTIATKL